MTVSELALNMARSKEFIQLLQRFRCFPGLPFSLQWFRWSQGGGSYKGGGGWAMVSIGRGTVRP